LAAVSATSTGTERITKSASDKFSIAPASTTPKANASCKWSSSVSHRKRLQDIIL
jgi:hypothetical protein